MRRIALKIDVDTLRGTREGVPRLASLLERLGVNATFLFSLGPDHTGRAIRRVFRRGFVGKLRRTSVVSHYGLKTLLYGTLLPGPRIGRRCETLMREIAQRGFETGIHAYDHVRWQDGVASADLAWTREQLRRAVEEYQAIFGSRALIHGAAGWQVNSWLPPLQQEFRIMLASDVRGNRPFLPCVAGRIAGPVQLPTTLPTLDELIGRGDLSLRDPIEHLLSLTAADPGQDHVYTLHAEIEGAAYLKAFERLLTEWRRQRYKLGTLSDLRAGLQISDLPRCPIVSRAVPGRSGTVAWQGEPLR
ncbi:MAG: polysaccharide deacetylase family protein [Steroidobacteraceae bacterium]